MNMSEIIPIDTIEPFTDESSEAVVPRALADDPITGDGSAGREGVQVDGWRIHTLRNDRLAPMGEPRGRDRESQKAQRQRDLSRKARHKTRRSLRNYSRTGLAFLLVGAICAVAVLAVGYALELWGGHAVPNVVGLSRANAVAELAEAGFDTEVVSAPADEVEGHVISLDPAPGRRVREGSTITVTVAERRIMPDVLGMTREGATRTLEQAGAKNIRYEHLVLLKEEDKVLDARPAAGSTFMSSDEVTLVVGERPVVPGVRGLTEAEARDKLSREGIPIAGVAFEPAGIEGRLLASRTDPKAGSKSTEEGVLLLMGDPLVAVQRLTDYFDATTPHIHEFLEAGGLSQEVAHRNGDGHLIARYEDGLGGSVTFSYDPWSQAPARDEYYVTEIMQEGSHIEGVRMEVKSSSYKGHMRSYRKLVQDGGSRSWDDEGLEAQSEAEPALGAQSEGASDEEPGLVAQSEDDEDAPTISRGGSSAAAEDEGEGEGETGGAEEEEAGEPEHVEEDPDEEVPEDEGESEPTGESRWDKTSSHYEYTSYFDDDMPEGEVGKSSLASINEEVVGESCAQMVMGLCGFENMVDSCTQQSITLPKGVTSSGHVFYCCQGEMGRFVWTVLVRGSTDEGKKVTEVVATCLPKVAYESVDLEPFGNRICNFVAYQDEYVG